MAIALVAATATPGPAYDQPAADPSTADGQLVFTGVVTYAAPGTLTMEPEWGSPIASIANTDAGRPIYLYVYEQLRTAGALTMAPTSAPGGYLQTAMAFSGARKMGAVADDSSGYTDDAAVTPLSLPAVTSIALGSYVAAFTADWDRGLVSLAGLTEQAVAGTPSQEAKCWGASVGPGVNGPFAGTVNPLNPNDTWVGIALALSPASIDGNAMGL